MEELTLTTPSLLFSAVSLILLAYTNRFLSYAQLVRSLKDKYMLQPDSVTEAQIANLRKRLSMVRNMQIFGIGSLLLCVVSMFFIYVGYNSIGAYIFGIGLVLLIISLSIYIWEILISVHALELHLSDMEKHQK